MVKNNKQGKGKETKKKKINHLILFLTQKLLYVISLICYFSHM